MIQASFERMIQAGSMRKTPFDEQVFDPSAVERTRARNDLPY